jgi:NitT/TauT family transport system substrate-binding protein
MGKFIIQPHGRLQEWIAHEKGYFHDEGLDYDFVRGPSADTQKSVDASGKVTDLMSGAFESYKHAGGNKGVKSDISCACHWAVNQASAQQVGIMWGKSYVVTPGGIMVPPESPITKPEHLAGQEIAVGYHFGSHFTTIQSLEPFLAKEQIKLRFGGSIWARVDIGVGRDLPAVSVWGLSFQVLEQQGFRKVLDASFMIAFMFPPGVDPADVEKYMNSMKRAQMELDFSPEKYRHYYLNEIPDRYKSKVDVRLFSPGERIRFPSLH